MKVRKKSGEDTWVLVHAEIQGQKENAFSHRSFVYNYRAFELYKKPVVRMWFYTGSIPKSVVDALSSHAFGYTFDSNPK